MTEAEDIEDIGNGLHRIAEAVDRLAVAVERLGTNRASTNMGALELLSLEFQRGTERIADALRSKDGT